MSWGTEDWGTSLWGAAAPIPEAVGWGDSRWGTTPWCGADGGEACELVLCESSGRSHCVATRTFERAQNIDMGDVFLPRRGVNPCGR